MEQENQHSDDEFLINAANDVEEITDPPKDVVDPPPADPPPSDPPEDDPLKDVVDPPPADPPPKDPPEDSFSFKEHFVDHENIDAVKSLTSRGASYTPEIENELIELRANKTQLETDRTAFEESRKVSPYGDDRYYKLDQLAKTDPELVTAYQNLLFGNPDPLGVIKQDLLIKHPDIFKDAPEELQRRVEMKYKQLFDEEVDKDSDEYKVAYQDMLMDSKIVKDGLMNKINEIKVPDPLAKEKEENDKQKEFVDSWTKFAPQLKTDFVNISVQLNDEKGVIRKESLIDVVIPEKEQNDYLTLAGKYITQEGLQANEESLAKVINFAQAMWIANNRIQYNTLIANEMAAEKRKELREMINNPKKDFSTEAPKQTPEESEDDEAIRDMRRRDNE